MDYERNKKYFAQANKSYPIVISASLIIAGLLMILILSGARGINTWLMYSLGVTCLLAGAVIWIIFNTIRIKDSEIDALRADLKKDFETDFRNHFLETDIRKLKYEQLHGTHEPQKDPVFFGTYCFDNPAALHKRGSDGKSRSSIYSRSGFLLKSASICIAEREISLISDEIPVEFFIEERYADLSEAALIDPEITGYSGVTHYQHLRLTAADGSILAEFPILGDAAADEYVAEINSRIRHAKKEQIQNN